MNRLAEASSPYLQQHASNPVDWYPWCEEAFEAAEGRGVPVFLSIGYSACHWCHVMEHESFDNESIASLMNERFVNIKVDREERPDLDQIYMSAVMAMNGHGGWPMSVFLNHDRKPFYSGTYWPPESRMNMPGFRQILTKVSEAWRDRREAVDESAEDLARAISAMTRPRGDKGQPDEGLLHGAMGDLLQAADGTYGGFGGAPKFPHPMDLRLLLRCGKRFNNRDATRIVKLSCDRMAAGGIYDHLGGGFARYATDSKWLVPHFEKMLYDNALLTTVYVEAYQETGEPEYGRVIRETLEYVNREMTQPEGAFSSTQDADSEGEEGKFFVWNLEEIRTVLGTEEASVFSSAYDVSESGNWEGKNILNRPRPLRQVAEGLNVARDELIRRLDVAKAKLFEHRSHRIAPGTDDKVIVAWNGMMMTALSQAARVLNEPVYAERAAAAGDFVMQKMRSDDGRLFHTWRNGKASVGAFLDDYACLVDGLVELHQATGDEKRIDQAAGLVEIVLQDFGSNQEGAFFFTRAAQETPISRIQDSQDGATPSGNGMLATALLKLGVLTGEERYMTAAEQILAALDRQLRRSPMSGGQSLLAVDHHLSPMFVVTIQSDRAHPGQSAIWSQLSEKFLPGVYLAWRGEVREESERLSHLFEGKERPSEGEKAWLCHRKGCLEPVTSASEVIGQIESFEGYSR